MQLIKSNYIGLAIAISVLIYIGILTFNTEDKLTSATYNQDIAQIINDKCVGCHRPGEIGPMPLQTYQQVTAFITPIEYAVKSKRMPPWHASPAVGQFANDRSLSEGEYQKLLAWINQGYPEGTGKAPTKTYTQGWQIGKPDVEFTIAEPISIPKKGEVDYQYQIVPTHFTEDKWISAAEIRTEQRGYAHHVIVSVLPPDSDLTPPTEKGVHCAQSAQSPQAFNHDQELLAQGRTIAHSVGRFLAGWGVGIQFNTLPTNAAILIPAGSRLLFELHYVTNGVSTIDSTTKIGLTFSKEKVTKQIHTLKIINQQFVIPPRAENHEASACYTLTEPVTLLELLPHMHLRGKDFSYSVTFPDGSKKDLLHVPHYDFDWQTVYRLAQPIKLPEGSRLDVLAHFDNSPNNKHNPNPEQEVFFGEQTDDEMLIGYAVVMTDIANP